MVRSGGLKCRDPCGVNSVLDSRNELQRQGAVVRDEGLEMGIMELVWSLQW